MKKVWITLLVTMVFVLYGCSPSRMLGDDSLVVPSADPKGPASTVDPSAKPQNPSTKVAPLPQPVSPIQGTDTPMASPLPTPYQSDLQNLINIATEDMAERFSIPKAEIEVEAAYSVIWPDAGLGCSQSGMASAQVLTPGYLILLEHNDMNYEYHADKGTYVTYCENPSAPIVLPDQ